MTWVAAGLGVALTLGLALYYRYGAGVTPSGSGQGFPVDDAWIHAQFALNAARGAPFQYNLGELSSGSTAPLWSLLFGLGHLFTADPVAVGHLLGVAFAMATAVAAPLLARRRGLEGPALLLVPLCLAAQWRLTWAALSGMEITLATALVLATLWVYEGERRERRAAWRSGALLGLLFWTRPEGLLLGALLVLDQGLLVMGRGVDGASRRRRIWRAGGLVAAMAALVLPLFALNWACGPGPLPQTLYAKAQVVPLGRGWHLFWAYLLEMSVDHLIWHLFFVGAAGWMLARGLVGSRRDPGRALPGLFVLGLLAAVAFFKGSSDHYSRYLMPALPILVVLGVEGLALGARALGRLAPLALLGAGAGLVATATGSVVEGAETYAVNVASVNGHVVAMGRWAARHVPPGVTLAMSDVGAIAYFTENPVIDMRGLVSDYHGWDRRAELDRQRREGVAYALLFPRLNERVILGGRYIPIHALSLDVNNISATDNLVAYRTPWADGRRLREVGQLFDFEDGTCQGWRGEGSLGGAPAEGARPGQRQVINLGGGRFLLSSWGAPGGDRARGRAVSPELLLLGDVMTVRIGGGQLPGEVGLRLWVDGRIERTAVGDRSEVLVQREWDLRPLQGRRGRLELFDEARGGWGHVMLDEVHQYRVISGRPRRLVDWPAEGLQEPAASQRAAEDRGLLVPDDEAPTP